MDARHRDGGPVHVVFGRAGEHHDQADRVRSPLLDQREGFDDISAALREGPTLEVHHPLVDEPLERLGERHQSEVEQDLGDEARVQEMQDGVLDTPL